LVRNREGDAQAKRIVPRTAMTIPIIAIPRMNAVLARTKPLRTQLRSIYSRQAHAKQAIGIKLRAMKIARKVWDVSASHCFKILRA
jgi:hypothetical protein